MLVSIIKPINHYGYLTLLVFCALMLSSFRLPMDAAKAITWSNHCLNQCYNPVGEAKLKKWELSANDGVFIRLRKTYQSGRQEYYSLQLKSFDDIVYLGNTAAGTLELKSNTDDVIVQTYNDPKGDQDDMAQVLSIPVKNMEPERLDSLRNALLYLKSAKPPNPLKGE
jgi:hypothetical protein